MLPNSSLRQINKFGLFVAARYDGGCGYFQVAQTVLDENFAFERHGIRQMNVLEWMRRKREA